MKLGSHHFHSHNHSAHSHNSTSSRSGPSVRPFEDPAEISNLSYLKLYGRLKEMVTTTYTNDYVSFEIGGNSKFAAEMQTAIKQILETEIGRQLFASIRELLPEGEKIDLRQDTKCFMKTEVFSSELREEMQTAFPGEDIPPDIYLIGMSLTQLMVSDLKKVDDVLFHELTHLRNHLLGSLDDAVSKSMTTTSGYASTNIEEIRTVGIPYDTDNDGDVDEVDFQAVRNDINTNNYRKQKAEAKAIPFIPRTNYTSKISTVFEGDPNSRTDALKYKQNLFNDMFEPYATDHPFHGFFDY